MRLLVTRPEPGGTRTAASLRDRGWEVVQAPLLTIEPIAAEPVRSAWDAVVLTSANAVRAIAGRAWAPALRDLPAYAVGRHTAAAARDGGFNQVITAGGDAATLRDLIRQERHPGARLLYLAAEHRAGDLTGALAGDRIAVDTVVVYRAAAVASLPSDARDALAGGGIDGVLHFSRRTAGVYLDCARAAGILAQALVPAQLCLSDQVAEPLRAAGAVALMVAAQPREADLLALAAALACRI